MSQGSSHGGQCAKVASIRLDDATRQRILKELGVQADMSWVPETIQVARLSHQDIGQAAKLVHPNPWVLIMV